MNIYIKPVNDNNEDPFAVVALCVVKPGIYNYAVAICSDDDTFNIERGKTLAINRLRIRSFANLYASREDRELSVEENCVNHINTLALSVRANKRKWQSKLCKWKHEVIKDTIKTMKVILPAATH